MTKKLKDFPEELKLFDNYLVTREKDDLKKLLYSLPKYKQYYNVLGGLKEIQRTVSHKDSVISLDVDLLPVIKDVTSKLANLDSSEEYKQGESTIKKYKKSKTDLIQNLLEEPVEFYEFVEIGYYHNRYKILNLPNTNIGRFHQLDLSIKNKDSTVDSVFCGNLILPELVLDHNYHSYSSLLLMCSGDLLYEKNSWNENCINFMSTKFNAKKTLKNTIDGAIKNKKVTGNKPEWLKNYEMMK